MKKTPPKSPKPGKPNGRSPAVLRHKKIKALKCFGQVKLKLMEGIPCTQVAAWIQEEAKELVTMRRNSLEAALADFKADIPPAEILAFHKPAMVQKAEEELDRGVWLVKEMEALFILQRKRVEMGLAAEKKDGALNPALRDEIKVASALLLDNIEMRDKLGLLPSKKEGEVGGNVTNIQVNTSTAAVVEGAEKGGTIKDVLSDPKKAQNIREFFKTLISLPAAQQAPPPPAEPAT